MIIFALISNSRSNNIYGEIQSNLDSILYPEETETKNIIWTRGEDEETISEPDSTESEVESEPESITEDEITDIETDTDKNEIVFDTGPSSTDANACDAYALDEEININFKDSVSPAIIKPLKGDKYTYLILPNKYHRN